MAILLGSSEESPWELLAFSHGHKPSKPHYTTCVMISPFMLMFASQHCVGYWLGTISPGITNLSSALGEVESRVAIWKNGVASPQPIIPLSLDRKKNGTSSNSFVQ